MKKAIAFILMLLLFCSFVPAAFAEDAGIIALKLNPYGGEESAMDTITLPSNRYTPLRSRRSQSTRPSLLIMCLPSRSIAFRKIHQILLYRKTIPRATGRGGKSAVLRRGDGAFCRFESVCQISMSSR